MKKYVTVFRLLGEHFFSLQLKPYIEGRDNENARFACSDVVPIHLSIMTYISD